MQNAQRILPPRLPQVRARGNRDLFAPGPWFFVASLGPRRVRSAAHTSGPGPGSEPPMARQRPAGLMPSPRPAAAALSAGARDSDRGQRWLVRKLTEPETESARVHEGAARSAVSAPAPASAGSYPIALAPERVPRDAPCPGHSPALPSPVRPPTRSAGAQPLCRAC